MRLVDWEYLRGLLEERLNIPAKVLDYISVKDILQLCASGSSNANIARFTNIDLDYVVNTIRENLHFDGWDIDRDLNPYMVYRNCLEREYPKAAFIHDVVLLVPYYNEVEIVTMYRVVEEYYIMEKEMEEFWI